VTASPVYLARLESELPEAPDAPLKLAPRNPQDVASILKYASDKKLEVQVWGGGTRSGYGSPPDPDIVMSMGDLNEVEIWEPDDLTLVVGAGASVAEVEVMLAERKQTAVLPEVPGTSTIGGVIATGASAFRRTRLYGTRERVLEVSVVTGDGRIVRGGGRVVKNVTGYDLPRLMVGAFGSLGVVVSVCLKLWPVPSRLATVTVDAAVDAVPVARPLAVLEDRDSTRVFVWGTPAEVAAKAVKLGGDIVEGHNWPADPDGEFGWSLRVPPALTTEAVGRLPDGWAFVALHGVGELRAGSTVLEGAAELREWAEAVGGHLIVTRAPAGRLDGFEPWGAPPAGLEIQRRLIAEFDPARVINPGRLPGGL
jgi:glycolate dehydrogenase FAD-binding subunit